MEIGGGKGNHSRAITSPQSRVVLELAPGEMLIRHIAIERRKLTIGFKIAFEDSLLFFLSLHRIIQSSSNKLDFGIVVNSTLKARHSQYKQ